MLVSGRRYRRLSVDEEWKKNRGPSGGRGKTLRERGGSCNSCNRARFHENLSSVWLAVWLAGLEGSVTAGLDAKAVAFDQERNLKTFVCENNEKAKITREPQVHFEIHAAAIKLSSQIFIVFPSLDAVHCRNNSSASSGALFELFCLGFGRSSSAFNIDSFFCSSS
jgi:hypothetical protein